MKADIVPHQSRRSPRSAAGGFTLVELMVTIVIMGVLAAVAVPSYRNFISSQRVRTAAFDLTSVLFHARSEALKRNADVTLAPASGGWQNGWTMSVGSTVLSRHEPLAGMTVTAAADSLVYRGNGRLNASAAAFSLSAAGGSAAASRCVTVSLSGIPASRSGACS